MTGDTRQEIVEHFTCDCHTKEHTFQFSLDIDPEWGNSVYLTPFLITYRNVFERAWYALKYVFGQVRWKGAFDEVHLTPADIVRFKQFIDLAVEHTTEK